MRTLTEQEAFAISRLCGNLDFDMLLKWFQDSYDMHSKDNNTLIPDVQLRQSQGKTQVLFEVMETTKNIRTILDRFIKQRSGKAS